MATPDGAEWSDPTSTGQPDASGEGRPRAQPVNSRSTDPDRRGVAPGSPDAVAEGCCCSVLANAAYRCGGFEKPVIDPHCPVDHGGLSQEPVSS